MHVLLAARCYYILLRSELTDSVQPLSMFSANVALFVFRKLLFDVFFLAFFVCSFLSSYSPAIIIFFVPFVFQTQCDVYDDNPVC